MPRIFRAYLDTGKKYPSELYADTCTHSWSCD